MRRHRRLDFAELDAESAELHLLVAAPEILDVSVTPVSCKIARAVKHRVRQLAERIKGSIGVTIGVQIVPEGSIERSTGKMRRIIDNRNP